MSRINMKNWISQVIQSKERMAIPIMTYPGIELTGKSVYEAVTNGKVHFEAIKALYDQYPSAATTVIMDLTVEAEAFGASITFPENEVPSVTCRLVTDYESVKALEIPDLGKGRIAEYLKANELTAEYVRDGPVFAGCIGPYSLAGRLFDMTEIMIAIYTEPETVELLLTKCTEFITSYCRALKSVGVNGVVMAEPASGLLSNDDCSSYSSVYIKKIVDAVQDETFSVILHNCGNGGHCTKAMLETGAASYHFGNKINMIDALRECPSDVLVMGNLDPVGVFKMGTVEEIREATLNLLQKTSEYDNFVLSSGCDIPPEVPVGNIESFYNALNEYNKKN